MLGEKRRYVCVPYTAEEMSKPLPTLPWARQWLNCARLCTRSKSDEEDEEESCRWSDWVEVGKLTMPKCASRPAVRDVTRPAEEPSPVLLVWWMGLSRGVKGGRESSEEYSGGRDSAASCRQYPATVRKRWSHLITLRVEVVVCQNNNLQSILYALEHAFGCFGHGASFPSSNGLNDDLDGVAH
jgi:hypothetical protein